MPFQKGHKINLGRKLSEEIREKISLSKKGCISPNKGIKNPLAYLFLGKYAQKGATPWNKGKKVPQMMGDKNPNWNENVGYRGIHHWIQNHMGKASHCSFNPTHVSYRYEWANVSGSYLRDVGDWVSLCKNCHKQYDWIRSGYYLKQRNERGQFI